MATNLGQLTASGVGILMKEMVRRAIVAIRAERFTFEAQAKKGYGTEELNDLVTTADKAAQVIYLKTIRESFPGYGIIAEEDNLVIPCTLPPEYGNMYFTIDPLDGTKAFGRRQSHGVGTMIALVKDGEVISAWVGDINTQEIYGYRPESNKVHRISDFECAETLAPDTTQGLEQRYIIIRDMLHSYSFYAQGIALERFKEYKTADGSIGITMAQLWKGEVGGVLLRPFHETPWDMTPIIGISQKLGFRFYEVRSDMRFRQGLVSMDVVPAKEIVKREHEVLVIHSAYSALMQNTIF